MLAVFLGAGLMSVETSAPSIMQNEANLNGASPSGLLNDDRISGSLGPDLNAMTTGQHTFQMPGATGSDNALKGQQLRMDNYDQAQANMSGDINIKNEPNSFMLHESTDDDENETPVTGGAVGGIGPDGADHTINSTGLGSMTKRMGGTANPGCVPGSTLTEFTKRRNWSQKVLDELRDLLHILSSDGRILYVSPSCRELVGYEQQELVGKFIVDFIHADDSGLYIREFNESIASGYPLRFFYRFRKADNSFIIFEAQGHPHLAVDPIDIDLTDPSRGGANPCHGFFMLARPYPTKNASLLDSFLEHKIENERLTKRINDVKREEREEAEAQQRRLLRKQEGQGSVTPSDTQKTESETQGSASMTSAQTNEFSGMPPPARPASSDSNALTQQNLDEANATSRPDSITDKMARYEGVTHIDSIEMLTGLRYRDGERSQGISTGDAHPTLIRGDAGISIPADKLDRFGDKKKKLKVADEYVCTDCGTLDSPEWRKGPSGPKTLCNACGLRWAKREKKEKGETHDGQSPPEIPSTQTEFLT